MYNEPQCVFNLQFDFIELLPKLYLFFGWTLFCHTHLQGLRNSFTDRFFFISLRRHRVGGWARRSQALCTPDIARVLAISYTCIYLYYLKIAKVYTCMYILKIMYLLVFFYFHKSCKKGTKTENHVYLITS